MTPSSHPLITWEGAGKKGVREIAKQHQRFDISLEHARNLANANLELEGLAPVVAGIKLLAVREGAPVVHREGIALTNDQDHKSPAGQRDHGAAACEQPQSPPSWGSPCRCRASWL